MTNHDDEMVTGMGHADTFGNEDTPEATDELINRELRAIQDALPGVETQVAWIDEEITKLLDIRDFVETLQALPSDVPENTLRMKLELRYLSVNQLLAQRADIISRMSSVGKELDAPEPTVAPPTAPIFFKAEKPTVAKAPPFISRFIQRVAGWLMK
jgi:hypothetical protein